MLTKCCCKGNNKNNASPCFRLLQNREKPPTRMDACRGLRIIENMKDVRLNSSTCQ
nr:MAG TPA: hypothetical protein [Bacteriophage sp.]